MFIFRPANLTHFQMKGCALGPVLKQKENVTRKIPVLLFSIISLKQIWPSSAVGQNGRYKGLDGADRTDENWRYFNCPGQLRNDTLLRSATCPDT